MSGPFNPCGVNYTWSGSRPAGYIKAYWRAGRQKQHRHVPIRSSSDPGRPARRLQRCPGAAVPARTVWRRALWGDHHRRSQSDTIWNSGAGRDHHRWRANPRTPWWWRPSRRRVNEYPAVQLILMTKFQLHFHFQTPWRRPVLIEPFPSRRCLKEIVIVRVLADI